MKYEILIYAGRKNLTALDVTENESKYISINGYKSVVSDKADILYGCLLDYYNVDNLAEIKAEVSIINGGAPEKTIEFLISKLGRLSGFSLYNTEKILPVILLNKKMIGKNKSASVKVADDCYKVTSDDSCRVMVERTETAETEIFPEDFTLMNYFNCINMCGSEEEIMQLNNRRNSLKNLCDNILNECSM